MSRRPRRYRARVPRGIRWLRFRHRLRRILTLGIGRRRERSVATDPDEAVMERAHAEGQRLFAAAQERAAWIDSQSERRRLAAETEAREVLADAQEHAHEIVAEAERVARDYLEGLEDLLGPAHASAASPPPPPAVEAMSNNAADEHADGRPAARGGRRSALEEVGRLMVRIEESRSRPAPSRERRAR